MYSHFREDNQGLLEQSWCNHRDPLRSLAARGKLLTVALRHFGPMRQGTTEQRSNLYVIITDKLSVNVQSVILSHPKAGLTQFICFLLVAAYHFVVGFVDLLLSKSSKIVQ